MKWRRKRRNKRGAQPHAHTADEYRQVRPSNQWKMRRHASTAFASPFTTSISAFFAHFFRDFSTNQSLVESLSVRWLPASRVWDETATTNRQRVHSLWRLCVCCFVIRPPLLFSHIESLPLTCEWRLTFTCTFTEGVCRCSSIDRPYLSFIHSKRSHNTYNIIIQYRFTISETTIQCYAL